MLCTTHWAYYDKLARYVREAAARGDGCRRQPGTVAAARFVDAGVNASEVRVISSGGISCGMDASLHVVKLRCGEPEAIRTAEQLDYAWRKTEGFVMYETSS